MPGSAFQGKHAGIELLRSLSGVRSVVDVGPGHGTWRFWTLMWDLFTDAEWTAVEIFEPYVERYQLKRWYDEVVVGDAAALEYSGSVDLAIFGDVVEHLPKPYAQAMVLRVPWRHALVSIPIGPYPQGPSGGNAHEAHLSTWTVHDVCTDFPVVRYALDHPIGVFLLQR